MNSLNILYEELDFKNGGLHPVMADPFACPKSIDWIEKGEWLAAAKRAGAEKIFFVDNNPVAVFAAMKIATKTQRHKVIQKVLL